MVKVMILIGIFMYLLILGASKCERRHIMSERNCKECIYHTEDGCTKWECEFVSREEVLKAYKEAKDGKVH